MNEQFMSEDNVQSQLSYPTLFKKLWPFAKKEKWLLFVSLTTVVIAAIVGRAIPFVIGEAVDAFTVQKNVSVFRQMTWIYLGLECSKMTLSFLNIYVFQVFGNRMLYHLREHLFTKAQILNMDYFNRNPVGRTVTRLTNDTNSLGELFANGVISVLIQGVILIFISISLFIISWKLALLSLSLAPVFVWASVKLSDRIRITLREQKKVVSSMNSFISENFNGMKVIQLYNRIPTNRLEFLKKSEEHRLIGTKMVTMSALMQPIMNLFNATSITAALYFGGLATLEGALPIGALVAYLLNIQDFIFPLREILEKYQQFQNSMTSAERIFQLEVEPSEQNPTDLKELQNRSGQAPISSGQQIGVSIEIKNLTFQYAQSISPALNDVSLTIPPGKSLAVIGRTGSGKTTLMSLLQRFYNPPAGTIFLDGVDITQLALQALRRKVGVIQQDVFLFRGTIFENITLRDASITEERVRSCCDQIGYLQFLEKSGRDLNFKLDERGSNLSAGERQLISFCRILAFQPEILILDEATAHVDSETEKVLQTATEKASQGRTSIIVAHRLSTVENCDLIAVLDEGRLVEFGPPLDLVLRRGAYYQFAVAGVNTTSTTVSAAGIALP